MELRSLNPVPQWRTPSAPEVSRVPSVLLVDGHRGERRLVADLLAVAGMRVAELEEGRAAVDWAAAHGPDLIILDVSLDGIDGLELCRHLRASPRTATIPLLILSARAADSDRALGIEAGADDYVAKPFNVRELVARVRGLLRRSALSDRSSQRLTVGPLAIDVARREVTADGSPVRLTDSEFRILLYVAQRAGRVCTREEIAATALDVGPAELGRAVDAHVTALRRKLGTAAAMIETIRGAGYRLSDAPPASAPDPRGAGAGPIAAKAPPETRSTGAA